MLKGPFGSDMKKSLFVEKGRETYKVYTQINAIQNDETLGSYYISKEYYEQKIYRFEVKPNDYIITCDGTLGKLIRLSPKMEPGVISPSLLKITINENKLNPKYFEYIWSNYMLDKLIGQARNTCLIHLPSATVIGKLIIPLPEIDKQNEFSSFIKQIENSTFDLNQTFLSLQNTVKSLMKQHIG
jgi:type I restriction enzyme S subunit